jgi:hypothetical protein
MERKSDLSLRSQKHLCCEESSSVFTRATFPIFGIGMTNEFHCAKLKETFDSLSAYAEDHGLCPWMNA